MRLGHEDGFVSSFLDLKQLKGWVHDAGVINNLIVVLLEFVVFNEFRHLEWQLVLFCHYFRFVATCSHLALQHAHSCG